MNEYGQPVQCFSRGQRLLVNATCRLVETYRRCNPQFGYASSSVPRRVLTHPSEPAGNDGFDNEAGDYLLAVNDTLRSDRHTYTILEMLGSGTFGQVVLCEVKETGFFVAVKVVKNRPAYHNQALQEVNFLKMLNSTEETRDLIVQLLDNFEYRRHQCLVFERLHENVYELLKRNKFHGLLCHTISVLGRQIGQALCMLDARNVVHCDLKPENILFVAPNEAKVKIIDYGSACIRGQTIYTYIQSRHYRSPEVLFGLPYDSAIDLWSFGCVCAELFLGIPLFPGSSEYNQVVRIIRLLGMPSIGFLEKGYAQLAHGASFERSKFNALFQRRISDDGQVSYALRSAEEYSALCGKNGVTEDRQYFKNARTLEELIMTYPYHDVRGGSGDDDPGYESRRENEMVLRKCFLHFLKGLFTFDPAERWTADQVMHHPFITGESVDVDQFYPPPRRRQQLAYTPTHMHRQSVRFPNNGPAAVPIMSGQFGFLGSPLSLPSPQGSFFNGGTVPTSPVSLGNSGYVLTSAAPPPAAGPTLSGGIPPQTFARVAGFPSSNVHGMLDAELVGQLGAYGGSSSMHMGSPMGSIGPSTVPGEFVHWSPHPFHPNGNAHSGWVALDGSVPGGGGATVPISIPNSQQQVPSSLQFSLGQSPSDARMNQARGFPPAVGQSTSMEHIHSGQGLHVRSGGRHRPRAHTDGRASHGRVPSEVGPHIPPPAFASRSLSGASARAWGNRQPAGFSPLHVSHHPVFATPAANALYRQSHYGAVPDQAPQSPSTSSSRANSPYLDNTAPWDMYFTADDGSAQGSSVPSPTDGQYRSQRFSPIGTRRMSSGQMNRLGSDGSMDLAD